MRGEFWGLCVYVWNYVYFPLMQPSKSPVLVVISLAKSWLPMVVIIVFSCFHTGSYKHCYNTAER